MDNPYQLLMDYSVDFERLEVNQYFVLAITHDLTPEKEATIYRKIRDLALPLSSSLDEENFFNACIAINPDFVVIIPQNTRVIRVGITKLVN